MFSLLGPTLEKLSRLSYVPAGLAIEVVLSHRVMHYFTESQLFVQSFTQSEGTKSELEITN